jgi:hypothetical protein
MFWSMVSLWVAFVAPAVPSRPAVPPCADPGFICAEFDAATAVFTGTVVSLSAEPLDVQPRAARLQTVIFEITEAFKGTAVGGLSIDFNLADEQERRFAVGETVVAYLRGSARTRLSTVCTRTRRIAPDDPELMALRELVHGTAGGVVEGALRVFEGSRPPALAASTSLDHLDVSAESVDRKETITVKSQAGGYFVFPWLEPGRYRIRFDAEKYAPVVRDVVIDARQRCLGLDPMIVQLR